MQPSRSDLVKVLTVLSRMWVRYHSRNKECISLSCIIVGVRNAPRIDGAK